MAQMDIHAGIMSLPDLVNGDAALVRRGRYLTTTFLVEVDGVEYLIDEIRLGSH